MLELPAELSERHLEYDFLVLFGGASAYQDLSWWLEEFGFQAGIRVIIDVADLNDVIGIKSKN